MIYHRNDGAVVVILQPCSRREDAVLLNEGRLPGYNIDRRGKYRHAAGDIRVRNRADFSYTPDAQEWSPLDGADMLFKLPPNDTTWNTWHAINFLHIKV